MTKRIGIDPATPYLDRTAAFSELVGRVRGELAEGESYSLAGGNRLNVPDRVAEALGLDGPELNPNARPVEIAAGGPADVHERAAAEVERARGIAPARPDAETAKKATAQRASRKRTAAKKAARKRTAARKSTTKAAAKRSTATKKG